jgi:hypothetical protein
MSPTCLIPDFRAHVGVEPNNDAKVSRKTGVCRMHAPLESPAATASDTSPEMPRTAATASNHRKRQLKQRPSHPTSRLAQWPVSPFVAAFLIALPTFAGCRQTKKCPAPPVARRRAATALPGTPPRPVHGRNHAPAQLLLRPHSQTPAFVTHPTKVRTGDQAGG